MTKEVVASLALGSNMKTNVNYIVSLPPNTKSKTA